VWDYLKAQLPFKPKDSRCSFGRFLSVVTKPMDRLPEWQQDAFFRTYTAIECDFLRGKKFGAQIRVAGAPAGRADDLAHTHRSIIDTIDRSVRDSCANTVSLSVLMLSNESNQRLCTCVLAACQPLTLWEGHANKINRSAAECRDWAISQATGGFMDHLNAMVKALRSAGFVADAGFITDPIKPVAGELEAVLAVEADFADIVGKAVSTLAGFRVRRGLWYMHGWPQSACAFLKDTEWQEKTMARFTRDEANFKKLSEMVHAGGAYEKKVQGRHQFNTTPVKQLTRAFVETGHRVTHDVENIIQGMIGGPLQTQLIEEINGVQKNRKRAKHSTTFRKPEACFAATLESNIVSNKHRFNPVQADIPVRQRTMRLPKETFEPKVKDRSLPFDEIVSTSSTTTWHSPCSNDNCVKIADLQMIEDAKDEAGLLPAGKLQKAWQGVLLDATHNLVVAIKKNGDANMKYYLALASFESSSCAMWPLKVKQVPHYEAEWFDLAEDCVSPSLVTIFDMTTVTACSIEWLPPLCVYHKFPNARGYFKNSIAVLPFKKGNWGKLHKVAAHAAFWSLGRSTLDQVAEAVGAPMERGAPLFTQLFSLVKHITKLPDSSVLKILCQRLGRNDYNNLFGEEVLCLDEALEVLDEADQKLALQQQRDSLSKGAAANEFKLCYVEKAKAVNELAAADKKPAKKAAKVEKRDFDKVHPGDFDIDQPSAKRWLPPGAYIWRGVTTKVWHGHLKPFPRVSKSFGNGTATCKEGLRVVLKKLWDQYLTMNGLGPEGCPHVL
jgi:hypothetical protein